ncbi:MAG: HNH endonuclease [Legionellaceae bacterium]|nr:HNH endonuclease [Legionellaceae bacterium]
MKVPIKPFNTYKWRWLSVQPSEGLLKAPVFIGVLRALQHHQGQSYSSLDLNQELKQVKADTGTNIDLARTPERNLFRNSGQYWRGTGLLEPLHGTIRLTGLGNSLALGQITNDEFAALMVRNTVLPNPLTYNSVEMKKWVDARLRIKPFEMIIAIMDHLGKRYGIPNAYLTPNELIKVIIPMAGEKHAISQMAEVIYKFRGGKILLSNWPDCAPDANDKRLAREFLLFLENFEICQTNEISDRYNQKFYLDQLLDNEIKLDEKQSFLENIKLINDELDISRNSEIPIIIERKRVAMSVIRRPNQSKFRKGVIEASEGFCILTNETVNDVLEAAHIVPVGHGGTDIIDNGLCMRVDIHRLYDSGKIRISPDGMIELNNQVSKSISYRDLPRKIAIPLSVKIENLIWRTKYL